MIKYLKRVKKNLNSFIYKLIVSDISSPSYH